MATIIGRHKEIAELNDVYKSDKAELVAVYGRRRVGKTFLVDQVLKGKITFRHAGLSPVDENGKKNLMADQLKQFYYSLLLQGMKKSHIPTMKSRICTIYKKITVRDLPDSWCVIFASNAKTFFLKVH